MFGTESPCDVEMLNHRFILGQQTINDIITNRSRRRPSLWFSMFPKGTFKYGEGYTKKRWRFHGGMGLQDGSASWQPMMPMRAPGTNGPDDPGHDPCRYESPVIGHGFDSVEYSILQTTRRTYDTCLTDMLFIWQWEQQFKLITGMLADVTLDEWENFARDVYMTTGQGYFAIANSRGLGMAPYTNSFGTNVIAAPAGGLGTIGFLNMALLNRVYQMLYREAREGMIGGQSPDKFIYMLSQEEVLDLRKRETAARSAYANMTLSEIQVEGYGKVQGMGNYGFFEDPAIRRYKPSPDGTQLIRVYPWESQATTIGDMFNLSMDYINAPFEEQAFMLKGAIKLNMPPPNPTKVGTATFGASDNWGRFRWKNITDRCENPDNEKGFYFAKLRAAPEEMDYADKVVRLLVRRDVSLSVTIHPQGTETAYQTVTDAEQLDPTEAAGDATEYVVLSAAKIAVGLGDSVTCKFGDASEVDAVVIGDADAPRYVIEFAAPVTGGYLVKGTTGFAQIKPKA